MSRLVSLSLLLGLGCASAPPPPLGNRVSTRPEPAAPAAQRGRPTFTSHLASSAASRPGLGTIHGVVLDHLGEPLVGVVVVGVSPALQGEVPAISDEHGRFTMADLPPGHYTLAFYYVDATHSEQLEVAANMTAETRLTGWAHAASNETIEIRIRD